MNLRNFCLSCASLATHAGGASDARSPGLCRCGALDPLFSLPIRFSRRHGGGSFLHKQNAIIARRPIVDNFVQLKTCPAQFIDQNFLLNPVVFAILRHSFHSPIFRMRRKVNNRQPSSGLQGTKNTRVKFQRFRKMVIHTSQKNRVATRGWQIRFRVAALDHVDVAQIPFRDFVAQLRKLFFVDFCRKDSSRSSHDVRGSERIPSVSRADIRNGGSLLPVHECRKLWDFIRGRGPRMQRKHKRRCGGTAQRKQKPSFRFDFSIHGKFIPSRLAARAPRERSSLFADVFVPQYRVLRDKVAQHLHTFFRRKINHFDSVFLKPVDSPTKIHGLADNHDSDSELANQSAAIPAWRKRRHHDFVAIAFLAPRSAQRIGLPMRRRIAILHSAVVPAPQEFPGVIEKSRADRNPALREPTLRLFDRSIKQRQIARAIHLGLLAACRVPGGATTSFDKIALTLWGNIRCWRLKKAVTSYFKDASTFLPYSRPFARISVSFSVRSFLSRMTMRPPITTVSTSLPFSAYASCAYTSYMGTAFGSSSEIRIMSAFFPTSSEPICLSICSAFAPSMVAISTTDFAPSARGSILVIFCSFAARSISSIKSRSLLLPAGPSVPRPTAILAARSSMTGATPLASIMLLEGLCTQPTWRSARILRSFSSTKMQCAASTSGPRTPSFSRYCTGVKPFCFRLSSSSFFISATWMRIGAWYLRARAAESWSVFLEHV